MVKMKNIAIFLLLNLFPILVFSQTARYELRMENPANHYFQVDFFLKDYKTEEIEVNFPKISIKCVRMTKTERN